MSLFAYKSITLSTLGTTCTLLTTCAARQYLLGVNACFCLFIFVCQSICVLFVCLFCVSLFVGLNVCLFVCLLAGWLVVHHDLFSQNNSDCHLHKETLVCSKFEVGLMKILSLACNLAFYNCLVVPSSSDQKCLVVPSLRSRSTIPFVSQYHHKKIGLSKIMDERKATRSFQMLQLCRKVLDISMFHGQQLTLRFHTQQRRLCSKKTKNGKKRE